MVGEWSVGWVLGDQRWRKSPNLATGGYQTDADWCTRTFGENTLAQSTVAYQTVLVRIVLVVLNDLLAFAFVAATLVTGLKQTSASPKQDRLAVLYRLAW